MMRGLDTVCRPGSTVGGGTTVASVDEIVTALQSAIDELNDSISATSTAESGTEDMISLQSAAGVQDKVQAFSVAKDAIEKARQHLSGGSDLLDEAINAVKAAGG
jgi:exonuclease VII small subunit